MNIGESYPELECIRRGNPFIAEIVKADDIIDDHTYEGDRLGIDAREAERVVLWVSWARLAYELALLEQWWRR